MKPMANSCPLEYGKAVDEARSMLGLINETEFPNVDSVCIPPVPREKNPIEIKKVQIVCSPNPSQGLFNLELPSKSENYDLKIFNYLGQQVFFAKTNGANQFAINLLEYAKGIYVLKVYKGNIEVYSQKLVLVQQ